MVKAFNRWWTRKSFWRLPFDGCFFRPPEQIARVAFAGRAPLEQHVRELSLEAVGLDSKCEPAQTVSIRPTRFGQFRGLFLLRPIPGERVTCSLTRCQLARLPKTTTSAVHKVVNFKPILNSCITSNLHGRRRPGRVTCAQRVRQVALMERVTSSGLSQSISSPLF